MQRHQKLQRQLEIRIFLRVNLFLETRDVRPELYLLVPGTMDSINLLNG